MNFISKKKISLVNSKAGSTLVYAMVVMLVLVLLVGVALSISLSNMNSATSAHVKDQSYYTAYSVSKRVADWLVTDDGSSPLSTSRFALLDALDAEGDAGVATKDFTFTEADLGAGMGSCVVKVGYADESKSNIKISTLATNGAEETNLNATIKTPQSMVAAMTDDGADSKPTTVTVPKSGTYILEVWGAQGGRATSVGNFSYGYGGAGGYAYGEVYLEAGTVLTLTAGSAGIGAVGGTTSGGFNGGGSLNNVPPSQGGSGGGASDIRIGSGTTADSYARLIVAGGGGGGTGVTSVTNNHGNGGFGGGVQGAPTSYGATQVSGFAFGLGGQGSTSAYGAGGGGWYGGSAHNSDGGDLHGTAGGGGSGWVYTATAFEAWSGVVGATEAAKVTAVLGAIPYLQNTKLYGGNQQVPSINGGSTTTGREGNGYVKVTFKAENDDTMPPTNVSPNIGPVSGGQAVTVKGDNFITPGNSIPGGSGYTGTYDYTQDSLIVYLDALNKDGLGDGVRSTDSADANKWKNLVADNIPNGNIDFNLINNPDVGTSAIHFNNTSYAVSASNLNLDLYSDVTVEVVFKQDYTDNPQNHGLANYGKMVYEYSPDWNNNIGGFGQFINATGGAYVSGWVHTNFGAGPAAQNSRNYEFPNNLSAQTHTNVFSKAAPNSSRFVYVDGVQKTLTASNVPNTAGSFKSYPFYLAIRGSGLTASYVGDISAIRIYGKKLSQEEITHNNETDDFRFKNPPTVSLGGAPCTDVVVVDNTTIKCKTPAHSAGLVDCQVNIPGQTPQVSLNAYRYLENDSFDGRYSVNSITSDKTGVNIADTQGGDTITIKGKNFLYPPSGYILDPYVTDGLFLHYDGINNDNAGYSQVAHKNNITTWKDISGGTAYNGTIYGTDAITNYWNPQSFSIGDGTVNMSRWVYSAPFPSVDVATAEVVVKPPDTGQQNTIAFNEGNEVSGTWGAGNMWWETGKQSANHMFQRKLANGTWVDYIPASTMQSQTFLYNSSSSAQAGGLVRAKDVYLIRDADFTLQAYPGYDAGNYNYSGIYLNTTNQMRPLKFLRLETVLTGSNAKNRCIYYSARLYNRILTASEVSQNHKADIDRFLDLAPISVTFGDTKIHASNVTVIDDETIQCTIPQHAAGPVEVSVNLYGRELVLSDSFVYQFNPRDKIKWSYDD